MRSYKKVTSVEITYEDGTVDHYLASAGDIIGCNHVNTYKINDQTEERIPVYYITLTVTPIEGLQEDAV